MAKAVAMMLAIMLMRDAMGSTTQATWVVDPAVPGADVPAVGRSLLDVVTLNARGERDVPFPFERLVNRIEAAAGCSDRERCTRAVLIPLGRSLQRAAASPNYFEHPRVVVAVTEQRGSGVPLRDRLYLGYQEAQGLIEAISYNDAAGRFEFQLIKNYRAGATPQVFQARRTVCTSCHQNHAPIFSRQVWGETNANPLIASNLATHAARFNGIQVAGSLEISGSIDDSTERANLIAVTQLLWRSGCGADDAGDRCRRTALMAALQFALASRRGYERNERWQVDLAATLARNAKRSWASGLAIPSPDIPNRDPLAGKPLSVDSVHVPARLDPLVTRLPARVLPADGEALADELIRGIAASWSPDRIATLDAALLGRHAEVRTVRVACERRDRTIECGARAQDEAALSVAIDADRTLIESLRIGNDVPIRHLQAKRAGIAAARMLFTPRDADRAARLSNGDAIERIAVPRSGAHADAIVTLRADFSASLADMASPGRTDALPELIERAITHVSGVAHRSCCSTAGVVVKVEPIEDVPLVGLAAALEPHCGACHRTPDRTPPNFLAGDQQQVERAIAQCAARIYVRLAMSGLPVEAQEKTPMPPQALPVDVRASATRAELAARMQKLLRTDDGGVPSLDELLVAGYERLPKCLPQSTAMH